MDVLTGVAVLGLAITVVGAAGIALVEFLHKLELAAIRPSPGKHGSGPPTPRVPRPRRGCGASPGRPATDPPGAWEDAHGH